MAGVAETSTTINPKLLMSEEELAKAENKSGDKEEETSDDIQILLFLLTRQMQLSNASSVAYQGCNEKVVELYNRLLVV